MKLEAIVLNSHGVGQYAYTDHMPVWGETLCVTGWHIAEDGGKGTNVAVALGRLGVGTAYIGKVGNDAWGDLGEKWMQDAGVDTTYLYRTDEVATGTGLILLGPDGQNTIIDGDSSGVKLTAEEVSDALDTMRGARILVTGFEIPWEIALHGARRAKQLGLLTALNPSPLPAQPLGKLDCVDYLFVNEVEAAQMTGLDAKEVPPREILQALYDACGCGCILMTLGGAGAMGIDAEGCWQVPAVQVPKVVNTAGAGDGFMAATVAQLLRGQDVRAAGKWAAGYAALAVTIDGTIPAYRTAQEVEAFVQALP